MSDLHLQRFPVENPRGTAVIVHGLGEHSGRYAHVIEAFQAAGFSVIAYDHRGHGQSPGKRGALPKASTLLEDLASVIDLVDVRPLVLFGHSMGGLIAMRFIAEGPTEHGEPPARWHRKVDYLVASSPALAIRVTRGDRIKLALLRFVLPGLALPNGLDSDKVSHDPEVVRAYKEDPLNHDRLTPRLADFILSSGRLIWRRASRWSTSTLLLFAGADELVDPRGSRAFVFAAPRYVVTAREMPGLYHEIFNEAEPERSEVFALLRDWLDTAVK